LLVLLSCCSPPENAPSERDIVVIVSDENFENALRDIISGQEERPLRELTEWEWDRVSVFFYGDKSSLVEDEVGVSITTSERLYQNRGNILVFQSAGEITKVVGTINPLIQVDYYSDNRRSYGDDAVVFADPRGYGNCILRDQAST
jgi:hypothetical protein